MPSVLIFIFQKARARIVKWPEATTRWHLRTSVLMLLATLFFTAAPSLYNTHESHWKEYEAKYRAPLTPIVHSTEGGDEHTAKLDLRLTVGMNRGDRLQSDRGHGLHIDWGLCPGKMSYQWNRNNDLLIWRKAVGLR